MKRVNCPNCGAAYARAELQEGWCESCGHKVPGFILKEASGRPRHERGRSDGAETSGAAPGSGHRPRSMMSNLEASGILYLMGGVHLAASCLAHGAGGHGLAVSTFLGACVFVGLARLARVRMGVAASAALVACLIDIYTGLVGYSDAVGPISILLVSRSVLFFLLVWAALTSLEARRAVA